MTRAIAPVAGMNGAATDSDGDDAGAIARHVRRSLATSQAVALPFRHWLLSDVLPEAVAQAFRALPIAAPAIADTGGRRETNNGTRLFLTSRRCERFPVCGALAAALQAADTVAAIERLCAIRLAGSHLRIEYCQDTDGFWLEPHTDIRVKLFTMLVYLSAEPGAEDWGTDLYDAELRLVGQAPGSFDRGLIFVPGDDTWHGFRRRPIAGIRRSLIVNYVAPGWRARNELAYPDRAVA